ncbi:MAG: hypothetical protein KAQ74_07050, partial [Dehalococcoidia bacterium]|nr:hypothetical protein [Dehalococcoidia bacterium]
PVLSQTRATLNVALSLILCGLIVGCDDGGSSGRDDVTATGVLAGTVVDSPLSLPDDATLRSYPGAVVTVSEAIEAGTYKVSAESPVMVSYEHGEDVVELIAGAEGAWEVELSPGTYFVRAFFGEQSYSEDVMVEVVEGDVTDVTLELIHGV